MYTIKSIYINPEGLEHSEREDASNVEWRDKKFKRQVLRFYNLILNKKAEIYNENMREELHNFCEASNRSFSITVACVFQPIWTGEDFVHWEFASEDIRMKMLRQHILNILPRSMGNKYGKEPYRSRYLRQRRELFDKFNNRYNLGYDYEIVYPEEFEK